MEFEMWMNDKDFWLFIGTLFLLGVAIGCTMSFGIPWLWSIIKPALHALTA